MAFKMDDYVDVAERIRQFSEKYPDGTLQSELTRMDDGWLCKAYAYRSTGDTRPGIGHAFEPIPGKTPYTKDSEAMNAETSAWGRAIVACGFDTKKIASKQEVQARRNEAKDESPVVVADAKDVETLVALLREEGVSAEDIAKGLGAGRSQNRGELHPDFVAEKIEAAKARAVKAALEKGSEPTEAAGSEPTEAADVEAAEDERKAEAALAPKK